MCEPGVDRRPRPASMEAPIQGVNMPPDSIVAMLYTAAGEDWIEI